MIKSIKSIKSIRAATAILFLGASGVAHSATFTHTLRSFGFGRTTEQCNLDVQAIAQRFGADAGVEVLGAGCARNDVLQIIDGTITYVAVERAAVTTSDIHNFLAHNGHYRSVDDCQAALTRELPVFGQETGLTPFVSYCYKANNAGLPRYRVRIDAIGTSTVKKWSSYDSFYNQLASPEQALSDLSRLASTLGLHVFESSIDRDFSSWHLTVDYYGESEFYLKAKAALRWTTLAECTTKTAAFLARWSADAPEIVAACDKAGQGNTSTFGLIFFRFSKSITDDVDLKSEMLPQTYATVAACEGDRARVEGAMTRAGTVVFGTLCGLEERTSQPRMLIMTPGYGDDEEP